MPGNALATAAAAKLQKEMPKTSVYSRSTPPDLQVDNLKQAGIDSSTTSSPP